MSKPTHKKDPLRNAFRRTYFPPAEDSVAKVVKNLQVCKFLRRKVKSVGCRGGDTRRINAVERRISSKVRGKYWMAMEWYQSDNEMVSGKIAGKKYIEDRRKIGYSQVNNPIILRISYVYVTYILRN